MVRKKKCPLQFFSSLLYFGYEIFAFNNHADYVSFNVQEELCKILCGITIEFISVCLPK